VAFRGIYPATELKPTEFGIFSGARVMRHTSRNYDERWIRGFSVEYDTQPTVRLLEDGGTSVHTMFDGSGLARYLNVEPFFIEVEDYRSTFSLTGEDRFSRVLKQLEAVTQKAVEREFYNGYVTRTDLTQNQYLTKSGSYTFASSTPQTAVSVQRAVALLEAQLANSPTGEQGVIHMSRDAAALLGSQWLLMRVEDDKGVFHLETLNGTTCIIGSGYTGDGPFSAITNKAASGGTATITTATPHGLVTNDTVTVSGVDATFNGTYTVTGAPTTTTFTYAKAGTITSTAATGLAQMVATADVKWMFATGSLDIHVGKPDVVNDTLAHGYDVSTNQNNMRIKALRPAAVHFDPSMHYAVKVNLTA